MVNGLEGRRLTSVHQPDAGASPPHAQLGSRTRVLERTPFRRGTEVLIRMELEDNKRRRRISESEEAALLAVASPHLRSMIIAALDTGMRRGEMLALRFGDIDWTRRMITLRGATTKSRRTRLVPIGPHGCSPCSDGSASTVKASTRETAWQSSATRLERP